MTCIKKSETDLDDTHGTIIRLFNPTENSKEVDLEVNKMFKKAKKVNMLEIEESDIPILNNDNINSITIKIEANEIVSLKLC